MGGCREAAGEGGKAAAGLGPPPPPDDAQKDTQTQRGRTVRCAPPPRLPPARAPAPPLKRARIARLRKRFASFESWPLLMRRWFSIASSPAMQAGPRALAVCGPPRLDQEATARPRVSWWLGGRERPPGDVRIADGGRLRGTGLSS